jgi:hypothetical protein
LVPFSTVQAAVPSFPVAPVAAGSAIPVPSAPFAPLPAVSFTRRNTTFFDSLTNAPKLDALISVASTAVTSKSSTRRPAVSPVTFIPTVVGLFTLVGLLAT